MSIKVILLTYPTLPEGVLLYYFKPLFFVASRTAVVSKSDSRSPCPPCKPKSSNHLLHWHLLGDKIHYYPSN